MRVHVLFIFLGLGSDKAWSMVDIGSGFICNGHNRLVRRFFEISHLSFCLIFLEWKEPATCIPDYRWLHGADSVDSGSRTVRGSVTTSAGGHASKDEGESVWESLVIVALIPVAMAVWMGILPRVRIRQAIRTLLSF